MENDDSILVHETVNNARDRSVLRSGSIGKIEYHFIEITPAPTFRWIVAFDDRMASRVKMFGCMPIRRIIATADVAARPAQSQVHPASTNHTAMEACSHLATIRDVAPSARGCEECPRISSARAHGRPGARMRRSKNELSPFARRTESISAACRPSARE